MSTSLLALKRLCGPVGAKQEIRAMEVWWISYLFFLSFLQREYEELGKSVKSIVLTDFVTKPVLRHTLVISIALHMSQQITGIGSVWLPYLSYLTHDVSP